mmetsp:Transcript_28530/g.111724  ORF Transcript_28530/g.111724 Transcript_28530/m.111724 type:complete len:151 (+) Transcript_28530:392-844(+)
MAFVVGGFTGLNGRSGSRAVSRRVAGVVRMTSSPKVAADVDLKKMSLKDWERVLTPEQFRILRMKGTEYPGTGEYNKFFPETGTFACAGCGNPLFDAETKFNSGSGWPALRFIQTLNPYLQLALEQNRWASRPRVQKRRISDPEAQPPLR